jgi:hypothetical protein
MRTILVHQLLSPSDPTCLKYKKKSDPTFKHLLKIIKISHIHLYISTSVEVPSDLL